MYIFCSLKIKETTTKQQTNKKLKPRELSDLLRPTQLVSGRGNIQVHIDPYLSPSFRQMALSSKQLLPRIAMNICIICPSIS